MAEQIENFDFSTKAEELAGKYLTFALSDGHYGVEILNIQEIIGVIHITKVPKSPPYLKGIINLRGNIIPVIDLRLKFNLPEKEYDRSTCIIVVNVTVGDRETAIGMIVDTVLEVVNFDPTMIQPAPDYGANLESDFVLGMGRVENKGKDEVTVLIDIHKVLSTQELSQISDMALAQE